MLRRGRAATSSERRQPGRRQANKPCVLTRTGATLCPDAEPGPFLKAAAHRGGPGRMTHTLRGRSPLSAAASTHSADSQQDTVINAAARGRGCRALPAAEDGRLWKIPARLPHPAQTTLVPLQEGVTVFKNPLYSLFCKICSCCCCRKVRNRKEGTLQRHVTTGPRRGRPWG